MQRSRPDTDHPTALPRSSSLRGCPRAFARLEQQRAALVENLTAWPAPRRAFRPNPTAWSAVEVLDHLVRVEREILFEARRGLDAPHRRSLRDRAGVAFVNWVLRSDRRVRVPVSVPQVLPASDVDFGTVRRDWDIARLELGEFLAPLTAPQLRPGVFRHPVAGWMNVPQILRFLWAHSHHHRFQLARLRVATMPPDADRR